MNQYQVTLDNCDQEPIHIPNLIQPNGFLMVVRIEDEIIIQVSENIEHYTGLPNTAILGNPLSVIFANVHSHIKKSSKNFKTTHRFDAFKVTIQKKRYVCVPHSFQQNTLILEFEPLDVKSSRQNTDQAEFLWGKRKKYLFCGANKYHNT